MELLIKLSFGNHSNFAKPILIQHIKKIANIHQRLFQSAMEAKHISKQF